MPTFLGIHQPESCRPDNERLPAPLTHSSRCLEAKTRPATQIKHSNGNLSTGRSDRSDSSDAAATGDAEENYPPAVRLETTPKRHTLRCDEGNVRPGVSPVNLFPKMKHLQQQASQATSSPSPSPRVYARAVRRNNAVLRSAPSSVVRRSVTHNERDAVISMRARATRIRCCWTDSLIAATGGRWLAEMASSDTGNARSVSGCFVLIHFFIWCWCCCDAISLRNGERAFGCHINKSNLVG